VTDSEVNRRRLTSAPKLDLTDSGRVYGPAGGAAD
jgi:hypothetical protein